MWLGDRQPCLGMSHLLAILVGELAVPLFQHGLHRALPGPEGAVHNIARNVVFQLCPYKGSAFAGLHVEKFCKKHSRIYQILRHQAHHQASRDMAESIHQNVIFQAKVTHLLLSMGHRLVLMLPLVGNRSM